LPRKPKANGLMTPASCAGVFFAESIRNLPVPCYAMVLQCRANESDSLPEFVLFFENIICLDKGAGCRRARDAPSHLCPWGDESEYFFAKLRHKTALAGKFCLDIKKIGQGWKFDLEFRRQVGELWGRTLRTHHRD